MSCNYSYKPISVLSVYCPCGSREKRICSIFPLISKQITNDMCKKRAMFIERWCLVLTITNGPPKYVIKIRYANAYSPSVKLDLDNWCARTNEGDSKNEIRLLVTCLKFLKIRFCPQLQWGFPRSYLPTL